MRWMVAMGFAAVVLSAAGAAGAGSELEDGVALLAGGRRIDVEVGHAAPFVCDWNGDGKRDLLVGQMGRGRLRIYLNIGTETEPRFGAEFEVFEAGEAEGTVPTG